MKVSTVISATLCLAAASIPAGCATRAETLAEAQSIKVDLIAVSVSDVDAAIAWYSTILQMQLSEKNDHGNGVVVAFLEGNGLRLEIVKLANAIPFAAPDSANPATRHGVVKLTFAANDLQLVEKLAKSAQAQTLFPLNRSDNGNRCYVTFADPDGNWVQFAGPCPE
ncbi:VOC family protein [Pontixanthobacter aquaemixtae]|uniref:VOC domain-containing protein n=1 Tax=Pontixanthobacter aquaemixtae TaxID=1958940 RepID=A0A844ZSP5_9SPHN|nr:VOC family protein [Pontixanthobacter aquaemixtae]MXO90026.1 hypothetical protein [Pontixanthobacter aquaemixtae]